MDLNTRTEKNYGIALSRVLLSFMVVMDHFYNYKRKVKFIHILYYHIPTFFLMSFYYTNKTFTTFNISKIKLRFQRIVIPYISWSIISFILYNIYFYCFKIQKPHTLYNFLENLLNGHVFILALWFQNVLIFTTLIVSIVVLLFKNDYLLIFLLFFILSYTFQYSGINYFFFKKNFTLLYYATFGRFLETLPDSLCGFFIASFNITSILKYYAYKTLFICSCILLFISTYRFKNNLLSFKYAGIRLNTAAICIFLIFFNLPFNKIKNIRIKKLFDNITNYTAGIYFVHYLIGKGYIMKIILGNKIESVFGCLFIYFISYIVCFCLDQLLRNTKLKHLIK